MYPEEKEELTAQQPQKPEKEKESLEDSVHGILHDLVYILAVITILFLSVIRMVGVNGDSMFSTLHNGDYLILQNSAIVGEYEYGDIIVATVPTFSMTEPVVKRVIATGGQSVEIQYGVDGIGRVLVDGVELTEDYIYEPMDQRLTADSSRSLVVPEGSVFVMGDNRNHSADSRVFGVIDQRYILGKVRLIVLPGDNSDGLHRGGSWDWSRVGTVGLDNE